MLKEPAIRIARPEDLPALTALLAELFAIEQDFSPDTTRQRRGLALLLADERATVLVAEVAGQILGMVTLQSLISTAQGGWVGLLEDLVVAQEWRGEGLGSRLLAAVQEAADNQGLSRVQLLVDEDNHLAKGFYRSQGLRRTHLQAWRQMID